MISKIDEQPHKDGILEIHSCRERISQWSLCSIGMTIADVIASSRSCHFNSTSVVPVSTASVVHLAVNHEDSCCGDIKLF